MPSGNIAVLGSQPGTMSGLELLVFLGLVVMAYLFTRLLY